jgi:hypothetical protein
VEFTTVVATRIQSLLDRRGLGSGSEDEDPLSQDDPGMAALYASSIRSRIAVGSHTGYRVARLGDQIDGDRLDMPRAVPRSMGSASNPESPPISPSFRRTS